MDTKFQMARKEEERQSMLLAGGRTGASSPESEARDTRSQGTGNAQREAGTTPKAPAQKGKVSADSEGADTGTTRPARRRSHNKNRKPDGRAKRPDGRPRRSSKELGIEWIGSYCPDDHPHHMVGGTLVDAGTLFRCARCHQFKWMPNRLEEAKKMGELMRTKGSSDGYLTYLNYKPVAKVLLAKMQYLQRERNNYNEMEFIELVVTVMEDKNYGIGESDSNSGEATPVKLSPVAETVTNWNRRYK